MTDNGTRNGKDTDADDAIGIDLEAFFAAARTQAPEPSAEFLKRVEQAALAEQPARRAMPEQSPAPLHAVVPVLRRSGMPGHGVSAGSLPGRAVSQSLRARLADLAEALQGDDRPAGGWAVVSGLACAGLAGLWLGFAQPGAFGTLGSALLAAGAAADSSEIETLDLLPSVDSYLNEG